MRLLASSLALLLTLVAPPAIAFADGPTPTPTPAPTRPPAKATPTPTRSLATPSPSASATATPSAAPSPTPTPQISGEAATTPGAPLEEMRAVIAATSLAEKIDAERRLAAAERTLLLERVDRVRADRARADARIAEVQRQLAGERAALDRLISQTYRLSHESPLEAFLQRGSIVDVVVRVDQMETISAQQRDHVAAIRDLEAEAAAERDDLLRQEKDLSALSASVAAKDETLTRLAHDADILVAAAARGPSAVSDAEIEVLRSLADDAAREHAAADAQVAEVAKRAGVSLPHIDHWAWPVAGVVSQEFGPSALTLEPPATYRGVSYPHFHDAIDIAAPLGSPVVAAARGRVAFVGHIAGGAMVVILAHEDGLVSLYVHLDDTLAPPPVRAGDAVEAGQRIGSVGLTGITTGPHLHFTVRRDDSPIDPRSVLPTDRAP